MFDMKTYLNDQIKTKEMEDLIRMDNNINSEIRSIDGELQTMVYENYNKFISATDIVKNIKNNMEELDVELEALKDSISKINTSYSNVDNRLKYKWKEIKRLDTLEKGISHFANLRELPDALREAIEKYEANSETITVLEEPLNEYIDYQSMLEQYKDTSFLTSLYEEISSNVLKIKNHLRRDIEREDRDNEEFSKMCKYLINLGVDKNDIRSVFCTFKVNNIKKRIKKIKGSSQLVEEVDPKIQKRLLEMHGKLLKESHYLAEEKKVAEEEKQEKRISDLSAEHSNIAAKFDKKEIIEEIKERQTVSIGLLKSSQLKKGTVSWFTKKFSEQLVDFIIQTISEYTELFGEEAKPLKQFLNNFLSHYLKAQKEALGSQYISYYNMTECLSTVYNDATKIGQNIKSFRLTDRVCEIAESTIRTQLINSMKKLYKKTADYLHQFSVDCQQIFLNSKQLKLVDQQNELKQLVVQAYDLLMTECSITIGEARPLVKYQEQFLGSNNAFISLVHNQIVEYFQVFSEMTKVNLEKSSAVKNEYMEKEFQHDSMEAEMTDEKKIKGLVSQSLQSVEVVPLNSMSLLSIIDLCSKIKETGMSKVVSIVNDLVHDEETKNSDSMLGSVELWSNFELDKIPMISENLKSLIKHCNKFYVLFISKFVNERLRKYVKKFNIHYQDEPVLISNEIVDIFKRFKEEWKNLDQLYPDSNLSVSPYANIPSPELLEKAKKHGSIMLEMDMFSSRKKKIFSGLGLDRYSVFLSISLCLYKSLYERIRKSRLSVKAFEQLHADIYFMYKSILQFSRMEELNTINGMINQVMSSAINRSEDHKHLDILIVNNMVKTAQMKVDRKTNEM